MLEYLEQLIKEQKWEEALVIAEQLLLDRDNSVEDQLRINVVLITARAFLGEISGVVLLGEHSARMASDLDDWGTYLTIQHYVGYAYSVLDQWAEAKRIWFTYVAAIPRYGYNHLFEVTTWFHLGLAHERENDLGLAIDFYLQARRVAEANGNGRQVLGINHALIQVYTKQGKLELVPPLLAKTASFLRNNKTAAHLDEARLFHQKVRASFAMATQRYVRAKLIANRALSNPGIPANHQFHMHMILASIAKCEGVNTEMVDHYLRARVAAIRARRYDFEVDAAETLYTFAQAHPGALDLSLSDMANYDLPALWFEMDDSPRSKPRT